VAGITIVLLGIMIDRITRAAADYQPQSLSNTVKLSLLKSKSAPIA
jgi:hypothetical protein